MPRLSYDHAAPVPLLLLLLALLALASCGGRGSADAPSGEESTGSNSSDGLRAAAWRALESAPGLAGADHDPHRILVVYRTGTRLPPGWHSSGSGSPAVQTQGAASRPNAQLREDRSYEPLTDALAARYGLSIHQQVYLGSLNFASFELPQGVDSEALLARIRKEAGSAVEAAVHVPLRHAQYIPNDPDFYSGPTGKQWSHWQIGCEQAWEITRGNPAVIVGVVDTGARLTHVQLDSQVINPELEFPSATCDLANNDKSMEDNNGHGSVIAGLICAQADDDTTISGVAPLCRVLPIKISETETAGIDDLVAGALLADQLGAQILNYSWGGPDQVPIEQDMVNQLAADGVLFVCAAGNDALQSDEYPTAYANALSVGATDKTDNCSSFSNWGPGVDIAAPGESLKSCLANTDTSYDSNAFGTSFAAPLVCGGAALLWSYRPELSAAEVRSALVDNGPTATNFSLPIHRLDIAAALDSVHVDNTPSLAGVSLAPDSLLGTVAGTDSLNLSVAGALRVDHVEYRVDLAPLNIDDPGDLLATVSVAPGYSTTISLQGVANQTAQLIVFYYNSDGDEYSLPPVPFVIFNQRGDVNLDGVVGPSDLEALRPLIGLRAVDPGYSSFADSDLDGRISELDCAAVGYFYAAGSLPLDLSAVSPLSGVSGDSVAFAATLSGAGQLSFDWDFGGGAAPSSSTDPAPTVTLGPVGSYDCHLTVSDEFSSDSLDFTLEVTGLPGPTAVLKAPATAGRAPFNVLFDASESSSPNATITQYRWSWDGDSVFEDTTATAQNSHSFSSEGDYTVRLQVLDSNSATADATLPIHVGDSFTFSNWHELALGPFGQTSASDNLRLAAGQVSGCPALAWIWKDTASSASAVYVATALVPQPASLAQWRIDKVFEGSLFDSIGIADIEGEAAYLYGNLHALSYGRYHGAQFSSHIFATSPGAVINFGTLAAVDGRPMALFKSYGGGLGDNFALAYAADADPRSNQDWTLVSPESMPALAEPIGYGYQLAQVGSRTMLQHLDTSGALELCYSDSLSPAASGWHSVSFPGVPVLTDSYSALYDVNARPGLLYNLNSGIWTLQFSLADKSNPTLLLDFDSHSPDTAEPLITMAGTVGGHPAFGRDTPGGTQIFLAQRTDPSAPADWLYCEIPAPLSGNRRLVDYGGLPAVFAVDGSGTLVFRYPSP